MKKSELLELSFPYDWSNPDISDESLIFSILKRGIFEDLCKACAYFGIEKIEIVLNESFFSAQEEKDIKNSILNIKRGFDRAKNSINAGKN